MKIKYRFTQPLLALAMMIISIVYALILLIFLPLIFIRGLFCNSSEFWKMYSWYIDMIPSVPEVENENDKEKE